MIIKYGEGRDELQKQRKISAKAEWIINQAGNGPIEEIFALISENRASIVAEAISELEKQYSLDVADFHTSPARTVATDREDGTFDARKKIVEKLGAVIDFAVENEELFREESPLHWDYAISQMRHTVIDPVEETGLAALMAQRKVFALLPPSRSSEEDNALARLKEELEGYVQYVEKGAQESLNHPLRGKLSVKALELMESYWPARPAASSQASVDSRPAPGDS